MKETFVLLTPAHPTQKISNSRSAEPTPYCIAILRMAVGALAQLATVRAAQPLFSHERVLCANQ